MMALIQETFSNRLGFCEVCGASSAKYTCPKCEVKTCCLSCSQIHKKELSCNGIRDRTKFIPLKKMKKTDFMSDYYFLEECTRFAETHKNVKQYTRNSKNLPLKLFRLKNAAAGHNIQLKFLGDNFSRHKDNTSFLESKSNIIFWRVEWVFVNAENLRLIDDKCSEEDTLASLLDKYLNVENTTFSAKNKLHYYQNENIENLNILLKAEGVIRSSTRFFRLDYEKTLKENLIGKTIIEFPCIYITYDKNCLGLDVIKSDNPEDGNVPMDLLNKMDNLDCKESSGIKKRKPKYKSKKRSTENELFKDEETNFLFPDEKLWDAILSSSDSSNDSDNNIRDEPSCSGFTSKN